MGNINWKKVGMGALIASLGAGLTYLTEWASGMDFGDVTPLVTAALSVLVNLLRKWQQGQEG